MAKPPREMLSILLRSGDGRVVSTNQQEEIGMEATVEAPSAQTTSSRGSHRAAPPAITAWCLDRSGAHGVELHVPRRGQEVVFIHDERGEAALPQVPLPALPEVDRPRVPPMCLADGATQALGGLLENDQVNLIGHQAICPDRDLLCTAELRHELEVVLVIFLTEERLLSAVSPLGDMVGYARSYHTCQSSHGGKLTRPRRRVKS